MKNRPIAWLAGLSGVAVATAAVAQPADAVDRQARAWAAPCAACHGTEGRPQTGFPLLAGRGADELLAALLDFREGRRPEATVMPQLTKGYSEEELRRIARFYASLPMAAPNKTGARR